MRLWGLIVILISVISCGKKSSSHSVSSSCDGAVCETVRTEMDMGRPIDLLESKIETSIKLTESEIVFLQDASEFNESENTNCHLEVRGGDRYSYARLGETLEVIKADGHKMSMRRVSYSDHSIIGSWAWRGYESGIYKVVQFTFIGTGRIIMRAHCEN